ncbi:MAG: cell division protein SepF [Candidatus Aenigmatarchaeota archaeon]
MVLDKIKKGIVKSSGASDIPEEDFIEVGVEESLAPGKIGIAIEKLEDFGDTDRILKVVREGSLVFLKIKGLREKDLGELKRAVEKLKKTVLAQNGEIVGVEQDWLILAPAHAKVLK